jgi:hypothetical protein
MCLRGNQSLSMAVRSRVLKCADQSEATECHDCCLWSCAYAIIVRFLAIRVSAIAMEHLAKLRKLVSYQQSAEQTRAVLTEHFGTFKLEPVNEKGKLIYRAHGRVDFFGDRAVAQTGGAGGAAGTILPQTMFFVDLAV